MTHQEILKCSADQLIAMSDKELLEYYQPYLVVTRPELAEKPESGGVRKKKSNLEDDIKNAKKQMAMKLAASMGIDLNF